MTDWQPIATAPRDGTPIIGWCVHDADPYYIDGGRRLTAYGANAEGMSRVDDGVHIVRWCADIEEVEYVIPAWWCLDYDPQVAANPTHWMPVPRPPEAQQTGNLT